MPRTRKRTGHRAAFTMVELLVVMAIIAVLVSLTAVGVFRLIGVQQTANTNAELVRVQTEFKKQWTEAVHQHSVKDTLPPTGPDAGAYNNIILPMAGGDPDRARVLYVKFCLKRTFPVTINEALNPSPLQPDPNYAIFLGQLGYTTANTSATNPKPEESSICLLMALQKGVAGLGVNLEDLGVSSSLKDFPTPNGQTTKVLVDGWSKPVAFCRWPTGSTFLGNTAPGQQGFNDPCDPQGLLTNAVWLGSPGAATFQQVGHALPPRQGANAFSYRLYPVIASSGPDRTLGLDPNTFTPTSPGAADNLYGTLAGAIGH